jgi:hypothetical protein
MPERLPFACTKFQSIKDADFVDTSQAIHDGLLAGIAIFPTPPVLPAALQILIDNYAAALAAAVLLGKFETAEKNRTRFLLENALRVDCAYVNQIIYNLNAGGTPYATLRSNIELTNYELSKDPIAPEPLPTPENFRTRSTNNGEIYFAVNFYPNNRGLEMWYRPVTTPESAWTVMAWPRIRGTIIGLTRGQMYQLQCSYVGANPVRNFTLPIFQVAV